MSDCTNFHILISRFQSGEIREDEMSALDAHCLGCTECATLLSAHAQLEDLDETLPDLTPLNPVSEVERGDIGEWVGDIPGQLPGARLQSWQVFQDYFKFSLFDCGQIVAARAVELDDGLTTLLGHFIEDDDDTVIIEFDTFVYLDLLDCGKHQPDYPEAFLVATFHGRLHVVL